jgi:hypothetical protein
MLKDVTPYTTSGEPGLLYIMAEGHVSAWVREHVAELIACGYVRLAVTEHVPTRIVGDRRKGR